MNKKFTMYNEQFTKFVPCTLNTVHSKFESGQALILATIVLFLILINTLLIISGSLNISNSSKYTTDGVKAVNLAEAGIDKAVAALNKTGGTYNGEGEKIIGDGSYEVNITSKDASTNLVTATGYVPNKANAKTKKVVQVQVSKGSGVSFAYGVQVGEGGFQMDGGSRINGSVYSNGNIDLSGGAIITGDAYVAGGTQSLANQSTECLPPSPNCTDFIFGRSVSGNNQIDVAQSFRPSTSSVINKVTLKIKRIGPGLPGNPTVKIVSDNGGSPHKNPVLASGTLSSNLVTTEYGWIDVTVSPNYLLTANTTYWIIIDVPSANTTNYWAWSQDTLGSYTSGNTKWSPNMQQNPNPIWTALTGDLGFQVYMGGVATKITGVGSSTIQGNAYANSLIGNVTNSSALQIGHDAYYQTEVGARVSGAWCASNSHCHLGSTDPVPLTFPVSEANIADWKSQADDVVHNGDLVIQWPCTTNLDKKKYIGNVTIQGGCNIQTESPVWITGNLTVQGGASVKLKPSYGSTSGVIVVGGIINLTGGSRFLGSGDTNSYLMGLSTYDSPGPSFTPAITVSGGNSSSIVYAPNGIITLSGGTNLREVTAKKLILTSGSIVTYETGVANPFFTSGPTGSFSAIKGTYQVK